MNASPFEETLPAKLAVDALSLLEQNRKVDWIPVFKCFGICSRFRFG